MTSKADLTAERDALIERYENELRTLDALIAKPDLSVADLQAWFDEAEARDLQMQTYGIAPGSAPRKSAGRTNTV